ncbi:MAG: DUF1868 domain-containing protein [Hyphomicrobiales bacterium]|nr:DUF1868 domain-containing protein [Hyphomicrobiales bacterium]
MSASIYPTDLSRFAESAHDAPPSRLGVRYDRGGRFLPEAGDTVVCHTRPGSAEETALLAARDRLLAMPEADHFAFTPPESLHVTLFQGVLDTRRDPAFWPDDLALDATIPAATDHLLAKLDGFVPRAPFRFRPVGLSPTGLVVEGATSADVAALADWRDALADLFGYRHPDHETYVFHVTFAYPIAWLPDDRLRAWGNVLAEALADLAAAAPTMTFAPPAFCRFADMCFFEELKVLA